jgi:hypothetical protein
LPTSARSRTNLLGISSRPMNQLLLGRWLYYALSG